METSHNPFARPLYIMTDELLERFIREYIESQTMPQVPLCWHGGECPKNCFARTADGEPGLNYLCRGYHQFFEHAAPYMDFMANELKNQRPPANVMAHIADIKA